MNDKTNNRPNLLRHIPSVGALLDQPEVKTCSLKHGTPIVTTAVRRVVEETRTRCMTEARDVPSMELLVAAVCQQAEALCLPELPTAINATGVILHTGLGRARMAPEAAMAVFHTAMSHSLIEFNVETGKRGNRQEHVADLLHILTDAEETLVVNNCAAAVFLAISTLAQGRDVVISRGQMVEIGGGFRLPEIIEAAGARLREVGTTNKTRIGDYAAAITPDTALILRCQPSNFAMTGFVEETSVRELAELGQKTGVVVLDDQGSGNLQVAPWAESTVRASIIAGAGLVTFSGDKLLGGPQCGIIAGNRVLVHQLARHPLARVMRIDKLSLAGLRATLQLHLQSAPGAGVPAIRYINRDVDELKHSAGRLRRMITRQVVPTLAHTAIRASVSEVGGGSVPQQQLPTWCVVITPLHCSVEALAACLRRQRPAVIARICDGALWLDPRAMESDELRVAATAITKAFSAVTNTD